MLPVEAADVAVAEVNAPRAAAPLKIQMLCRAVRLRNFLSHRHRSKCGKLRRFRKNNAAI